MLKFFIDVFKEVVGAFKEFFEHHRKEYPREKVVQIVACGIYHNNGTLYFFNHGRVSVACYRPYY